ncbi:damage-control phosphatase ARMT1 family protein [Candidatus Magnetominusculus dajiuhuensis]|uniref:damage-control phosphatase ARMT1 family protein n=1 Tax=Candidatus Magnetominusculus dajiuhuensis TaxID=3137712 RepID=UPI003B432EAF
MKVNVECFPCFLRQTVTALSQFDMDDEVRFAIIGDVLGVLKGVDVEKTPAYATTFIYRTVKKRMGLDPYAALKRQFNEFALKLYPALKEMVSNSGEPLWSAARIAIAGNIIDFGIYESFDVEKTINKALEDVIAVDDFHSFEEALQGHKEILYLLDNAGEIVFDMLLIELLAGMGKHVTAVVKGSAVINDATMEDAVEVGLQQHCRVIDNGTDAVGTELEFCSQDFVKEYNRHSLVISKGQGNFETLEGDNKKNLFFLFQAKCDVIASHLNLTKGSMLLKGQ